jgi:hypothetical protein
MTQPPDPAGRPARPGRAPGPYDPPPPQRDPGWQPPPAVPRQAMPPNVPPAAPPDVPPGWGAESMPEYDSSSPPPRDKSFLGALFDVNFNFFITPKLIKQCYVLAIILISLFGLAVFSIGLWIAQLRNGWLLGLLVMLCAPVVWYSQIVLARILMEAIIVRFKGVEYLRIMKDNQDRQGRG